MPIWPGSCSWAAHCAHIFARGSGIVSPQGLAVQRCIRLLLDKRGITRKRVSRTRVHARACVQDEITTDMCLSLCVCVCKPVLESSSHANVLRIM